LPFGILIGGEELHNNHHAYPTSAKLSSKWYEFDVGWLYIRLLAALRLARVKHVAPRPRFRAPTPVADAEVLQAVITNRYDVLARFGRAMKQTYREELERMRVAPQDARALRKMERWLYRDDAALRAVLRAESVDDSEIREVIRGSRERYGALVCPHTATALRVFERLRARGDRRDFAVVATAHPAKFEQVIEPLIGIRIDVPAPLAALLDRPAQSEPMPADYAALRSRLVGSGAS
jgi:stearoyl-CoA desaturase (delta-9 desaturase)